MSETGVSLRVRQCYFDQIVNGEKKVELRSAEWYWNRRLSKLMDSTCERVAVFICGKRIHRRRIERITIEKANRVREILGREPSSQGREDLKLDWHDYVWAIWLGEEA